jgi:YD repeat-containing protein
MVKDAGGKLLCQPTGSNEDDPNQQLFYDARGRVIGGVDLQTGEQITTRDVVGKIGKANQA